MADSKISRRQALGAGLAVTGGLAGLISTTSQGCSWMGRAIDGLKLESDRWKLELTEKGAVGRLAHKPSGLVLLEGGPDTPAYELVTPEAKFSSSSAQTSSERIRNDRGPGVRFRHRGDGFTVVTEVIRAGDHGGVEFRLELENSTNLPVTAIRYPVLIAPHKLGPTAEDNVMLLPYLDGGIAEKPSREFQQHPVAHNTYPGPMSCQVVAYYNKTAGISVSVRDNQGYGKLLGATRLEGTGEFDLSISHLWPRVAARRIKLPYAVVVDSFAGDWVAAAEKYRDWSLRQPWSRDPLETSERVPDWLRNGAVVGEYDPTRLNLQQQRAYFRRLSGLARVPVIPNNRGWERYGMWCSSEYLPPRPDPRAFRESAALIKQAGGQGMIMLSGYRWTLEKPQPDGGVYSSQQRFDREVAAHALCGRDGRPRIWTSEKKNDWHGTKWARLCRAAEFTKKLNLEVARYCVEAGYPIIHWDQESGGAYDASVCYCGQHGHPPGDGRWIHLALADLYERFSKELAPLSRDFLLSMEEANELYMPYLVMAQSRPYAMGREWPCVAPMTRAVPLINYLHHEHCFFWAAYYPWRVTPEGINASLAKGFNCGLMPGISLGSVTRMGKEQPEQAARYIELFKSCMAGYRGYARRALMHGRMLRPLELPVPARRFQFKDVPPQEIPEVGNSVWQTPDGKVMVVLINHSNQDHSVKLDLAGVPGWSVASKVFHVQASSRRAVSGQGVRLELPKLTMSAIEVAPS